MHFSSGKPISASSTALVLVDIGNPSLAQAPGVAQRLADLVSAARALEMFTVFLKTLAADGSPGHDENAGVLAPHDSYSDVVIDYAGGSAFGASALPLMLRANGIKTLVIAGCDESLDLTCLARDAIARGFDVVIANDAALEMDVDSFARKFQRVKSLPAHGIVQGWQADTIKERTWTGQSKKDALLRTLGERIDPPHTALVIVDMQNDFCYDARRKEGDPDSMPLVTQAAQRTPALLAAARAAGVTVVHVHAEYGLRVRAPGSPWRYPSNRTFENAAFSASAAEITADQAIPVEELELCKPGSHGAKIIDSLTPVAGEIDIRKHRFSAFIDTPLDAILKRNGIRSIVLAGVTTHCCIESTARDAAMLDYYVVIAEDCVGSKDAVRHLHDTTLAVMRAYFGLVESSATIMACWNTAPAKPALQAQAA